MRVTTFNNDTELFTRFYEEYVEMEEGQRRFPYKDQLVGPWVQDWILLYEHILARLIEVDKYRVLMPRRKRRVQHRIGAKSLDWLVGLICTIFLSVFVS